MSWWVCEKCKTHVKHTRRAMVAHRNLFCPKREVPKVDEDGNPYFADSDATPLEPFVPPNKRKEPCIWCGKKFQHNRMNDHVPYCKVRKANIGVELPSEPEEDWDAGFEEIQEIEPPKPKKPTNKVNKTLLNKLKKFVQ